MADIKNLEASVAKAAEKVAKCKATIERHEKGLAKKVAVAAKNGVTLENMEELKYTKGADGYFRGSAHYSEICDIEWKLNDIKGATRKLRDAETILANWQAKLNVEIEKDRFLSEQAPAVIIEFLSQWKEMARDWYIKMHICYLELRIELQAAKDDAEDRYTSENPTGRKWGREYDAFMKKDEAIRAKAGAIAMLGGAVATMATYQNEMERLAWLERMLEEDRKSKLYDLIYRINEVVGTITDAKYLRVSEKGNLDGIIVGEKGKAKIETIGAGGYNIVCFHYRTLVHKLEDK